MAGAAPISRLVRSVDFERVLKTRSRASSAHFALHHLGAGPSVFVPVVKTGTTELSTGASSFRGGPVDDSPANGRWLGLVVPKRHARRAVTRTLLKRQMRIAVGDHAAALGTGLWVVRLRAPFDRQQFVSAASGALKQAARAELDQLLSQAAHTAGRR